MTDNCVATISCNLGDAVTTIASDRPADATTGLGSPGLVMAAASRAVCSADAIPSAPAAGTGYTRTSTTPPVEF